ncbi:TonB-dependent receptor [Tannerella forsythia KS16]|jgi:TonB family C-terminal domain|uniref:TonB-dependent receptor n=3 Tax=Tannerella forsythia TaxID=28112 RepID=G8UPY7_TANFA|nr:energy transducer TonB [Tannerella forsythia]AEW20774.1 TonB-dependent receptor [Tannerella forsythia 92A2]KKY60540.1 energy transducer TonB [Tannerella forsythia]OLQ21715.1 energy transducer TonB [Tannerella forsythia]PDP43727.1 energy transducer TonB [Tannerella forsythia]PDP70368.1 energy transducer TonB [Tannerella forsythia]
MEIKKSRKADLEGGKGLSILMGIVVGLAVLFVGFEWGTQEKTIQKDEGIADIIAEEEIDITRQEETPPPPPPPPPVEQVAEVLNVVEDDVEVENTDLLSSEDNQAEAQTQTYVPPVVKVEEEEESSQQIFMVVEEMPEFPGGQAALMSFIAKSIKYPVVAQENGIQGRVTCSFVVNKDGSIVDAEVIRGIDPSLDKEALRVINTMPKWKPGKQRGKPVRVKFTVPINFRLNQ